MRATYEALCDHGYSELTAAAIAERADKSKSLLFYHYDSKADLVVDFVDFFLERFEERVAETRDKPPVERLGTFVDGFLYGPGDRVGFHTAMLEVRAQAPYDERFRDRLRESDDLLRTALEGILRDGVEAGQFREHDPAAEAVWLLAALDGARIRQVTLDRDEYPRTVRSAVATRIEERLLADGVSFPAQTDLDEAEGDALATGAAGDDRDEGASEDDDGDRDEGAGDAR